MSRKTIMAIVWIVVAALLALILTIMIKTFTYPFAKDATGEEITPAGEYSVPQEVLKRFAGGIRIPTVSNADYQQTDFEPFTKFVEYMQEQYPALYENTEHFTVNDYSMVFRWKGSNPSLKPILFLSHYDVVPVSGIEPSEYWAEDAVFSPGDTPTSDPDTVELKWNYPPFSGAVADGRIYGRGTLDMKCMLFAVTEAVDKLMGEGFVPERDIWLAFGHDEETGGLHGATIVAQRFKEMGLTFDAVYDEGGIIATGTLPGIETPMALVGLGEKGFLTIRIKVRGKGGHSSMPPSKSSLVMAAEIIEKLNTDQMPTKLIPPIESFLKKIGGEMNFVTRMAIANQWMFKGLLLKNFSKTQASNALVRSTTAITMAKGSDAANVISSVSEITANFRLLPGDSVEDVLNHVEKIVAGYETEIEVVNAREPSAISPEDSEGFRIIERSLARVYPDAVVSSYITIGGTDSYKYQIVSDNIYRFMPLRLNSFHQGTIHNENEFITVENYGKMIEYFTGIMRDYGQD